MSHEPKWRRLLRSWRLDAGADVAYALRGLRRQPAFAAAALVTIALGIGATAVMLGLARAALVGAVPFARPDRLVHVWERRAQDAAHVMASYPDLVDWRDESRAFVALEGFDATNVTLTGVDEPVRLQGARVTAGFLATLGVRPALGRGFVRGEDRAGGAPVVVVSHEFWRRTLRGDSAVLGRALTLDGRPRTVIGVLPASFLFAPAGDVDVWYPLDADAAPDRGNRWLRVVGRLRDGVSVDRASAELAAIMRRLAGRYPETNEGRTAHAVPLRDEIVGPTRPLLLALGGAVALVLLVACANVAGLFLARALARSRELAVRAAIGAGRGRIVRQVLTESVLVAVAGAAAGTALAWAGIAWLAAAPPTYVADRMPFLRGLTVDAGVLGGTLVIALAAGLAFGLGPAIHAARVSFAALVQRGGSDGDGAFGGGARRALVVTEIALTAVLLVGAGLMTRSLVALLGTDPGFAVEHVATMRLALAGPRYDGAIARRRFFETLVERVRAIPVVRDVGAVTNVPLGGGVRLNAFRVEGEPVPDRASPPEAMLRGVAGDYFRAMGIPLVAGRAIGPRDDSTAAPAIVMSEGLARRLFGGASPIGRRVRFDATPDTAWTVVGVVRDVRATSLDEPAPPMMYRSHLQAAENRMTVVVRSGCPPEAGGCDPAALLAAMRREAHALDPALPVYQAGTMTEQIAGTPAVYLRRSFLLLLGGFAGVTLLLAAVGLYGVIAYGVARRTRELGIRAALGATRHAIVVLVLRQGAALAATGLAAGLGAAAALARVLGTLLYGVRAIDALTYGAVAVLLGGVTAVASLVPARRAARVNPTDALRAE